MKKSARLGFLLLMAAVLTVATIIYAAPSRQENPKVTSSIRISEVMSSNPGSVPDEFGEYYDWVELYNGGTKEEDIGGYGLSDDLTSGPKFVIPQGTKIPAAGRIIIWCSTEAQSGLHADFSINSGESVILFNSTAGTVDTVVLQAVDKGITYALGDNGLWSAMLPSPGYPNNDKGIEAYEQYLMQTGEECGIIINEFMASNATTIADSYGNYSDWIELYNTNGTDVDISGFGISDNMALPKKFVLPEGTVIPAKGYLIIFCSGNSGFSETGELHAPFRLKAYAEDVVFAGRNGAIVDSYSYGLQQTDSSMARNANGIFEQTAHPTPGFANDEGGYTAFMENNANLKGNVRISEIMGRNVSAHQAADGQYHDIIELENIGDEPVSLLGYALSDNPKNPAKWVFGDVTIPAHGFVVVNGGSDTVSTQGELYCDFGLSRLGDSIYLFTPEGLLADKLQASTFISNISYGRDASGELAYFESPTVGAPNGTGKAGVTAVPGFSKTPGVYDESIDLELIVPEGETVYYTLDCTEPTSGSTQYTAPIHMEKNTVIRAVSMKDGYITNGIATGTFLFTADGVNHALPIVTLVTDPDNLWNEQTGIYAFGDNYDPDLPYGDSLLTALFYKKDKTDANAWERPAAFSLFDEENKQQVFAQDVGIRIAGSFGRGRAQKGFNIFARDEYGDNRLAYSFFDNRSFNEYKALVLRAGGQDTNIGKFRDELATGLLEGSDVNFLYQAYRPCVLYLNGEYWGSYAMKEKRNRFFIAQHEGTEDNVNMDIIRSESTTLYGSNKEYAELMKYIDQNGASSAAAYAYLGEHIDLDSFMDYMICEIYSGNSDSWNIQIYKLKDGKWKWIYYDFCWSFGGTYNAQTKDRADHQTVAIRRQSNKPCSKLFNALLENKDWRDKFLRRFAQLLNDVYSPERVLGKIDELYAQFEPEITREREKFCGESWMGVKQHAEVIGTYNGFNKSVEYMRYFAQNRPESLKKQLQKEFGLSDGYMAEVFG